MVYFTPYHQRETKVTPSKKQLANLKPIKKGQVLNPNGGRAHNPALKALKKLTIESYREIIDLVATGNLDALRAMVKDKNTSALQVGIATAFMKAINSGDYNVIERIAERIIGKIPEHLNLSGQVDSSVTILDRDMIKKAMLKAQEDV